MEGRRNKKRKKDRKEEGIQGERSKEKRKEEKRERKKRRSSAGFKLVRLVLLVVLSVEQDGVVARIGFTFLPSWATLFTVVLPAVQFLMVLLLPSRPLVHQLCCP